VAASALEAILNKCFPRKSTVACLTNIFTAFCKAAAEAAKCFIFHVHFGGKGASFFSKKWTLQVTVWRARGKKLLPRGRSFLRAKTACQFGQQKSGKSCGYFVENRLLTQDLHEKKSGQISTTFREV